MANASAKRASSPTSETSLHKKARLFTPRRDEDKPQTATKVDPTYGQRSAFPGLDENSEQGEELFYGPADDGLAYLRMVRVEAKGVPNLLVAPVTMNSVKEQDLYAPYKPKGEGWYSDGAYVAAPLEGALEERSENGELDPQEAYYTALLERFEELRSTLISSPPSSIPQIDPAVRSLLDKPKPGHWKHALLKYQPTMVLLSSLPQENVIFGIEVLESLVTMKNLGSSLWHRLGAWAWGLLGRCRGVSEMDSEDVSVLRGLGKKACALLRRIQAGVEVDDGDEDREIKEESRQDGCQNIRKDNKEDDGENCRDSNIDNGVEYGKDEGKSEAVEGRIPRNPMAKLDEHVTETSGDITTDNLDSEKVSLEDARAKLLADLLAADSTRLPHPDKESQKDFSKNPDPVQISDAHATLDMIITLVGECYGQRDLLDARLAWEEL